MASDAEQVRQQLLRLNRIGIALTSVHDLSELLEMIVSEARGFTRSDAGSLYIVDGEDLQFVVSQNETLDRRTEDGFQLKTQTFPLTKQSIAGYVALTGETVNIPDAYAIPDSVPYGHRREVDEKLGYRTRSILAMPMTDHEDKIIGVLQLINSLNHDGEPVAFEAEIEDLVLSLASQAAVAINNARLTAKIKEAHMDTIFRLAAAAEFRDHDTAMHLERMSRYSAFIAEAMGLPRAEVELIRMSSPMHDVGKIGIPDAILLKPGRLDAEERKVMETHATIGASLLSGSEAEIMRASETVAAMHHEKWNGKGYPNGIEGEKIHLHARIVALADVFDALSSKRCYKAAMPLEKVMAIVKEERGEHFDPQVVDAFMTVLDRALEVRDRFVDTGGEAE